MTHAEILGVVWDGAGNVSPQAMLYRRLVDAGHAVRVLAHRSLRPRIEACGATFRPYRRAVELDACRSPVPMADERDFQFENVLFGRGFAEDVRAELAWRPADLVLVDGVLFSALAGVEAAGGRAVVVWHSVLGAMLEEPPECSLESGLGLLNRCRRDLDLPAVDSVFSPALGAAALLAATSEAFDTASSRCGSRVSFVGPLLDLPPAAQRRAESSAPPDEPPRVLISLSSGDQQQAALLQHLLDALATRPVQLVVTLGHALDATGLRVPANADVRGFQPHRELLPSVALVVTHAGHGTVMSALAFGVPTLCLPMGRDQDLVARRVEALGVGRRLPADASTAEIASTVDAMLADSSLRRRAAALGRDFEPEIGLDRAVEVIETALRQARGRGGEGA